MMLSTPPSNSIIIPARNAAGTISETFASLLAQTDGDWEAIVVDDGSTDATAAIAAAQCAADARFRLVQGKGEGASAARNLALPLVRGRRVLFLDSDDWIAPDFLERMNGALDSVPGAAAAYCGYRRVLPDGSLTPERSDAGLAGAPFERFARTCAAAIHAVLVDRETLLGVGSFDTSLRTCEDWELWQRIARTGKPWVHVDAVLSYYRASPNSLTQDIARMIADARVVIDRGFSGEDGASVALGSADEAHALFALWCAAFDCGRGGDGGIGRAHLDALPRGRDSVDTIAATIFDGLIVGAHLPAERVAVRWNAFGAAIAALIDHLGGVLDDPQLAVAVQYRLEKLALDYDDLAAPRPLGRTLGLRIDLRWPVEVAPDGAIDRLYVYLCDGPHVLAVLDVGLLDAVSAGFWFDLIDGPLADRNLVKMVRRRSMARLVLHRWIRRVMPPQGRHAARLIGIEHMARAAATGIADAAGQENADRPRGREGVRGGDRQTFWETLFSEEDPWNYGSPYEQQKYLQQLAMLPATPVENALELACAEGHFTVQLGSRVGRLLATDISLTAVERARQRCAALPNVDFLRLDLSADALPEAMDLIFCSEVLYYLSGQDELRAVAARLAGALRPGGHLITAHAYVLSDDPAHTGFDWHNPFGAKAIADVLEGTSGLALEESLRTELYRIDRYRKLAPGEAPPVPVIREADHCATLEPEVARQIVWGGASARRSEVAATESRPSIPVLMYHAVADDGPAELARYRVAPDLFRAQLRWLRQNGYHSLSAAEAGWFIANRHPLPGRPVLITFDDGFADFADNAWPILRDHDFTALVFAVTGLAGGRADWDARYGEAAPLMSPDTIAALAREGVAFGSHMASHRRSDGLATAELADELLRSRLQLERWTGQPVDTLAAPFGITDERLRVLAAQCGYRMLFSTEHRVAGFADSLLHLPRLEVEGAATLDDFARMLDAAR